MRSIGHAIESTATPPPVPGSHQMEGPAAHASKAPSPQGADCPDMALLEAFRATPGYGDTPDGAVAMAIIQAAKDSGLDEHGKARLVSNLQEEVDSLCDKIQMESALQLNHLSRPDAYIQACTQWLNRRALQAKQDAEPFDEDGYYDALGRC